MRLESGKCIYVQVKEASPSGGWSAKELVRRSVAQQFWQQWLAKEEEDRPAPSCALRGIGDLTTLNEIADAALCSRTASEFGSESSNKVEQESAVLAAALGISTGSTESSPKPKRSAGPPFRMRTIRRRPPTAALARPHALPIQHSLAKFRVPHRRGIVLCGVMPSLRLLACAGDRPLRHCAGPPPLRLTSRRRPVPPAGDPYRP